MKRFLRDFPLAVALQQREHLGNPGIRSGQRSGPALHFQVDDCDRLEDFDAGKPRLNVWRGAVRPSMYRCIVLTTASYSVPYVLNDICARLAPHHGSVNGQTWKKTANPAFAIHEDDEC